MKLIVFFNGWSARENFIKNYFSTEAELRLVNYPYDLKAESLKKYEDVFFAAWSFGVVYLNKFLNENKEFQKFKSVAINANPELLGSYGINIKLFDKTLKELNEDTLSLFFKNMGSKEYTDRIDIRHINISQAKKELEFFKENYKSYENKIKYYIISSGDSIVPFARQKKYCVDKGLKYDIIDSGHFPFYSKELEKLIGVYYEI